MKIENFIKTLIILLGVGLSYLKYNFLIFIDFQHLGLIIIGCILFLITGIYILNKRVYGLKMIIVNTKLSRALSNFRTKKINEIAKNEKECIEPNKTIQTKKSWKKEPFLWIVGAVLFGVFLGYYFKTFDSKSLYGAEFKKTEWQSELYLERIKSKNSFFELKGDYSGGFDFNWFAFFTGITGVFLIYFLIKHTTFFTVFKNKIKPNIK